MQSDLSFDCMNITIKKYSILKIAYFHKKHNFTKRIHNNHNATKIRISQKSQFHKNHNFKNRNFTEIKFSKTSSFNKNHKFIKIRISWKLQLQKKSQFYENQNFTKIAMSQKSQFKKIAISQKSNFHKLRHLTKITILYNLIHINGDQFWFSHRRRSE